jgi:hypothetical protein
MLTLMRLYQMRTEDRHISLLTCVSCLLIRMIFHFNCILLKHFTPTVNINDVLGSHTTCAPRELHLTGPKHYIHVLDRWAITQHVHFMLIIMINIGETNVIYIYYMLFLNSEHIVYPHVLN